MKLSSCPAIALAIGIALIPNVGLAKENPNMQNELAEIWDKVNTLVKSSACRPFKPEENWKSHLGVYHQPKTTQSYHCGKGEYPVNISFQNMSLATTNGIESVPLIGIGQTIKYNDLQGYTDFRFPSYHLKKEDKSITVHENTPVAINTDPFQIIANIKKMLTDATQ